MMSERNDSELKLTQELFEFLQGKLPARVKVPRKQRPKLTPAQAWTVIWYLGNLYWQVTDRVERCEVCGDLFHTHQQGTRLDYGRTPYNFCENCMASEAYARKASDKRNPNRLN